WRAAAEQIEMLYGDRWREFEPLARDERHDILRAGIGYVLGEDAIGVGRLRERYAGEMEDGADRRAFGLVTAPVRGKGARVRAIARSIASIDTLDAFLRDLRARYPDVAAATVARPRQELAAQGKTAGDLQITGTATARRPARPVESSPLPPAFATMPGLS